jgi:methyl-accepting chemotaxis protein
MKSQFRQDYDNKLVKIYLLIGFLHIPIFVLMTLFFKTELSVAIGLTTLVMAGPFLSYKFTKASNITIHLLAFSYMCLSAIMIHLGKGMIEMHFHIFATVATFVVFGYWKPVLTALLTVAVHHIGFFFLLPESLFNYEASFWIVLVHAAFAAFEAISAMFIAHRYGLFIQAQDEIMTNLSKTSDANTKLANDVNNIAKQTSESVSLQASNIQETAASLEEITQMINKTTENIQKTAENTDDTYQNVNSGKQSVQATMNAINEISQSNEKMISTMDKTSSQIGEIADVIKTIAEKTHVINDIVFQTKLLSFNASVEAARAGEHGKGFAVVAEEVGNLAKMSGDASEEINELIQGSLDQVDGILKFAKKSISEMTEVGKKVLQQGEQKSAESMGILENVVNNMNQNKNYIDQVNVAAKEQAQGINEITGAIRNLDQSNQTNNEMVNQLSHLSEDLDSQAKKLVGVVTNIQATLKGEKKVEKKAKVVPLKEKKKTNKKAA